MIIARTAASLAPFRACVLVPTMGGLHEGHAALIRRAADIARARGAPVVATLFVNPTQFNDRSDYERYPRTLDDDVALCREAGADAVFAPAPEVVYPPGETIATPTLPDVATRPGLEDRWRPGHFAGVCQVVRRLFDLSEPVAAIFGEKDWQQLQVVRAMSARDTARIEIIPAPTVREPDGLARSSRNRFLTGEDRARARAVPEALREACERRDAPGAEAAMRQRLEASGLRVQYAAVRDAESLLEYQGRGPGRALIAVEAGSVRLIDNCAWPGSALNGV